MTQARLPSAIRRYCSSLALLMTISLIPAWSGRSAGIAWTELPALPDPLGVAGAFAGISGDALIVAGGANFPGKMPWEGGVKVWHDEVFVLENPKGPWKTGHKLPLRVGYGVSVSDQEGVICIGGSNSERHLTNVFRLEWRGGRLRIRELPALPVPLANACGGIARRSIYIAGGTEAPEATLASRRFLRLNLSRSGARWEELQPWPGPARMLAAAAVVNGAFYLVGGAALHPGPDGKPLRTYLKDGYRFTPDDGWARIADLTNPVAAAPSPAPSLDGTGFFIVGGDDGSQATLEPNELHPGFASQMWRYEVNGDRWTAAGQTPAPRATLPTTLWHGLEVLVSGEVRPGVRSPEVWALKAERP